MWNSESMEMPDASETRAFLASASLPEHISIFTSPASSKRPWLLVTFHETDAHVTIRGHHCFLGALWIRECPYVAHITTIIVYGHRRTPVLTLKDLKVKWYQDSLLAATHEQ